MALGQSGLAGLARVAFQADTGQFNADISQAEARWDAATRGLSDGSLRVQLAQDKLNRELAKGPTNYRGIARAELELRRSRQGLKAETDQLTRSQDRLGDQLGRTTRGAILGSGAFRGLARSITFASASVLGGAGFTYALRSAIGAASALEEAQNKTRVTFRTSGEEVIEWSRGTASAFGIASDQALAYASTIGGILNVSGVAREESSKLSRQLVELAADMASFNDVTITEALDALRSGIVGEAEPLRRLQVLLSEARVKQEAYRSGIAKTNSELTEGQKVLARYQIIMRDTADQQGDVARTADGVAVSQRTVSALWREAQILLGQSLLPTYGDIIRSIRDWLAVEENRERLQREINTVVRDGIAIGRGFAGVLGMIVKEVRPLIELMGGLGRAVEIALVAGLIKKLGLVPAAFALMARASAASRTAIVADAAVEVAALNSVAVAAGRTAGAIGTVGAASAAGGVGRAGAARFIPGVGTIVAGALIVDALTGGHGAQFLADQAASNGVSLEDYEKLRAAARDGKLSRDNLERLRPALTKVQYARLKDILDARAREARSRQDFRGETSRDAGRASSQDFRTEGAREADRARAARLEKQRLAEQRAASQGQPTRRTEIDIQVDLARAQARGDDEAEKRLLREQRALYEKQIKALERRKNLSDEQKSKLRALYGQVAQTQGQLDAFQREAEQKIEDQREAARAKRAEARERAAERRRKAEEAEERRMEKIRESAAKAAERRAKLFEDVQAGSRAGLRRSALRGLVKTADGEKSEAEKAQDLQKQVRSSQFEFLQSLNGIVNQLGGNLTDPRLYGELKRQTDVMVGLASAARAPGTSHAKNEIDAAFVGSAF